MENPNNRPLGTNEKVFWVLDQKNNTQFAIAAELVGNAADRAWREAIDNVQNRHPNLSTRISGNSYQTAKIENVDGCKIPLRIIYAKTGEDWTSIVEEELNDPIDLSVAPLVRAVLVQQSGQNYFYICGKPLYFRWNVCCTGNQGYFKCFVRSNHWKTFSNSFT